MAKRDTRCRRARASARRAGRAAPPAVRRARGARNAQRRSPGRGIVLVGSDMPFVTGALLRAGSRGADRAALLEVDGRPQPLPARCCPSTRARCGASSKPARRCAPRSPRSLQRCSSRTSCGLRRSATAVLQRQHAGRPPAERDAVGRGARRPAALLADAPPRRARRPRAARRASAVERPAIQHASGAAVRSDACAAVPARSSSSLISSTVGAARPDLAREVRDPFVAGHRARAYSATGR